MQSQAHIQETVLKDNGISRITLINDEQLGLIVKKEISGILSSNAEREVEMLKCAHQNGVNVPLIHNFSENIRTRTATILMSYTPGDIAADGQLASISLNERYEIIKEIIVQVCRLHQAHITHGDLNIGNILWHKGIVQLIDFEAAVLRPCNHAKDIGEFARLVVEILTLKYPVSRSEFSSDELNAVELCLKDIGIDPGSVVLDLQKMIRLETDPDQVITMEEINKRSWLNSGKLGNQQAKISNTGLFAQNQSTADFLSPLTETQQLLKPVSERQSCCCTIF